MKTDPSAPGAAAVYLYREETVDDSVHMHTFYARIKVLTAQGKSRADVELPYFSSFEDGSFRIRSIEGRTIEPDGKIVPFTGKPYDKLIYKQGDHEVMEKVFTLPDVQVGSILEYRYILDYGDHTLSSPRWIIQQPLFVHEAHYHFNPLKNYTDYTMMDSSGHETPINTLLYATILPPGVKVRAGLDGYDLVIKDVPALVREPHMPPVQSRSLRVLFYYAASTQSKDFWSDAGKRWSKSVDHFASDSPVIRKAVSQIVSPADTPEQKSLKIYEAVMKLDNTDYTRAHSAVENKAEGQKEKNAGDIWLDKRGNSAQLTRLYIALARAAGLKAYDIIVSNRNDTLFDQNYLSWGQLDDELAIVMIDGKPVYLDPGNRFEDYGELAWYHCFADGVRQLDHGTAFASTPGQLYKWDVQTRSAYLTLAPDGSISGQLRIAYTGDYSRRIRQEALKNGVEQAKKDVRSYWQSQVPTGVQLKMNGFIGIDQPDEAVMAVLTVSGTMGSNAGRLRLLPADFFEANAKPVFTSPKRTMPVDLGPVYILQDQVSLNLPPNASVEGKPADNQQMLPQDGVFHVSYTAKGNQYVYDRVSAVAMPLYAPKSYPQLLNYFQKIAQADQQPLVLRMKPVPVTAATSSAPKAGSAK
ncbi:MULTISPECIES: DUF3857 domain-containing protein [Acidobacterium]|nr:MULTISPECIES: DUF3857 domain-containing protein [Acidobacterium]